MLKDAIKDTISNKLGQELPVLASTVAGFAFDTVKHIKDAVEDKAHATARRLDLVERAELDELRARVAVLEEKLKNL